VDAICDRIGLVSDSKGLSIPAAANLDPDNHIMYLLPARDQYRVQGFEAEMSKN
jgi:hypothetical protein